MHYFFYRAANKIFSFTLDGDNRHQILYDDRIVAFAYWNGHVYFLREDLSGENARLERIKPNGTERVVLYKMTNKESIGGSLSVGMNAVFWTEWKNIRWMTIIGPPVFKIKDPSFSVIDLLVVDRGMFNSTLP